MADDLKTWTLGDLGAEAARLLKKREEQFQESGVRETEARLAAVVQESTEREKEQAPFGVLGGNLVAADPPPPDGEEGLRAHGFNWAYDSAAPIPHWRSTPAPGWALCVYGQGDWNVFYDSRVRARGDAPVVGAEDSPLEIGERNATAAYRRLRENKVRLAEGEGENVLPVDLPVDWHWEPDAQLSRWRSNPLPGWELLVYEVDASWSVYHGQEPLEHGLSLGLVEAFHAVYAAYQRFKEEDVREEEVATHTYVTSDETHLCVDWIPGPCERLPHAVQHAYMDTDLTLGVYVLGHWQVCSGNRDPTALGKAATVAEAQREASVAVSQIIYRKEHGGTHGTDVVG